MRYAACGALAVLLFCASAYAEPTDADRAAATQLFKDGRALLEQKDYAQACPKLEESQRLDPGGGTLLNVALCHEGQGRLATAWTEYNEALGLAFKDDRDDRAEVAQQHIDALEPMLSRLAIIVPLEAALPGLELKRDGTVLGQAVWGSALPVDAGTHVIEVSAPGHRSVTVQVEVPGNADHSTFSVPVLELLPVPVVPPPVTPPYVPSPPLVPARPAEQPPTHAARIASYLAFGFSGAWLGAGAVTGALALAKRDESDALCVPICTQLAYEKNQEARPLADAATASLVIGGLSAALGVALLVIDLSQQPAARVTLTGGTRLQLVVAPSAW